MRSIVLFFVLLALVFVSPLSARAITIDEFNGNQESVSPGGADFSASTNSQAIGGARKIFAVNSTPIEGQLRARVANGRFSHSQEDQVSGQSTIVWDGTTGTSTNFFGLGGIDFLQDGGSAFRIDISSLDLAATLTLTIYDARDTSGQTRSSAVVNLSGLITNQSVAVPFSSFTIIGPNGPASFSSVGAFAFRVDGAPALDLSLNLFGTNGNCPLVPDINGRVIDECGVCGGDNSSCSDCAGTVNGTAQLDRCGICNGDGKSCLGCNTRDLSPLLTALDGGAKQQEHLIRAVLKQVDLTTSNRKVRTQTAKIRAEVHKLQIRNWTISWQIPRYLNECTNEIFCAAISTEPKTSEYRIHSEELRQYMETSVKLLRKVRKKGANYYKNYITRANQQHANNMALADTVPAYHMSCS